VFSVEGLRLGGWGLGFRVKGLSFRVWDSGFRVKPSGCRDSGLRF
jgi:hypothetical protein